MIFILVVNFPQNMKMPPIINQIMEEQNQIPEASEVNLAAYFQAAEQAEKEEREQQRMIPDLSARVKMALQNFNEEYNKKKQDISDKYENIRKFDYIQEPIHVPQCNHKYMNMKPYVVTQLQNYSRGISGDYFVPSTDNPKEEKTYKRQKQVRKQGNKEKRLTIKYKGRNLHGKKIQFMIPMQSREIRRDEIEMVAGEIGANEIREEKVLIPCRQIRKEKLLLRRKFVKTSINF